MATIKKPNLKNAIKRVINSSENHFGNLEIDLTTLPCLTKIKKEKITANFDVDLLTEIRNFASKNSVSYTSVMNDTLRKVFLDRKKAS